MPSSSPVTSHRTTRSTRAFTPASASLEGEDALVSLTQTTPTKRNTAASNHSPVKLLGAANDRSPVTETAVKDLQTITNAKDKASPALQNAFQRLMARAKQAHSNSNGHSGAADANGTAKKSAKTAVSAVSAAPETAVETTSPVAATMTVPPSNPAASDLATEILPAPPSSLQDPQYAPLNPELAGFVPGLAYALANPTVVPVNPASAAAVNGALSDSVNASALPTTNGHTIVRTAAPTNGTGSANEKKKKKDNQPTFTLASPDWYKGKVPFALYAMVNNRPEAVAPPTRSNRKRRSGKAVNDGRVSRSSTPAIGHPPSVPERAPSVTSMETEEAAESSPAEVLVTPQAAEVALLEVSPTSSGQLASQNGTSASDLSPSRAVSTATGEDQESPANGTHDDSDDRETSTEAETDEPHTVLTSKEDAVASDASPDVASASAAAPGDTETDARDTGRRAVGDAAQSSADVISSSGSRQERQQQTHASQPSLPSRASQHHQALNSQDGQDCIMTDLAADEGASQDQPQTGKAPALTGSADDEGASAPAQVATNGKASYATSRPASPASSVGGNGDHLGDISVASTSSLANSAARPTRRAAAKVAARGSYYSSTAFDMQAPLQAAVVHNIGAGGSQDSRNGSSQNGSAAHASTARSSVAAGGSRESTVPGDRKGKGKADGVQQDAAFEDSQYNNDFCSTCNGAGHFICCDSCPRSFHFACVNPPLDINEVPLDDDSAWHCRECSALRHPPPPPKKKDGIFGPLCHLMDQQNPSIFSLTPDIKNFFKGVVSLPNGTYVDASRIRQPKVDKKGAIEQRDPFRLRDAKGKEVLCFHCGGSALPRDRGEAEALASVWAEEDALLGTSSTQVSGPSAASKKRHGRRSTAQGSESAADHALSVEEEVRIRETQAWQGIVSCDFCPLHWHLDCLDPPLSNMPSNSRKWKCPCHIEDLLAHTRVPKSSTQLQVIDLPIPTLQNTGYGPKQFYRPRVLNSGEIDIIPDPLDNYSSSQHASAPFGRNTQPGWRNVDIPTADAQIPGGGIRRVRFRVPERIVRTDWWLKVLQGGRDRLLDVNAPFKYVQQRAREQEQKSGLDFLVEAALGVKSEDEDEEGAEEAADDGQLVRLVLNAASPASMRLQPLSLHESASELRGHVAHEGGKLKREEDEALPESSLRSSLDDNNGLVPSKRQREPSTDSREATKKARVSPLPEDEEELKSLRAVRELMRRKGESELLAFLQG